MHKFLKLFIIVLTMTTIGCNITGTVTDRDGNPVEGAIITLGGAASQTTTSDSEGAYSFSGLNLGSYNVSAEFEDMVFVYPTLSVKIAYKDMTANFVEYIPPEPAYYDLGANNNGIYVVETYSPKAKSLGAGNGTIHLAVQISQTLLEDGLSEFTCELLDFPGTIFEGSIDGDEYLATTLPSDAITLDYGGGIVIDLQFKSLRLIATDAENFTGGASVKGTYGIIQVVDTVQINTNFLF